MGKIGIERSLQGKITQHERYGTNQREEVRDLGKTETGTVMFILPAFVGLGKQRQKNQDKKNGTYQHQAAECPEVAHGLCIKPYKAEKSCHRRDVTYQQG